VDAVHFVYYQNIYNTLESKSDYPPLTSQWEYTRVSSVFRQFESDTWTWTTASSDYSNSPFLSQSFTVSGSSYSMEDLWFRGDVPLPLCERQCQSMFGRRDLYYSCIAGCACDYNAAVYSTNFTSDTANNGTCVDHCEMERRYVESSHFPRNISTVCEYTESGNCTSTWTLGSYVAGLFTLFALPIGADDTQNGIHTIPAVVDYGIWDFYPGRSASNWTTTNSGNSYWTQPEMTKTNWMNGIFFDYVGAGVFAGRYQTRSGSSNAETSYTGGIIFSADNDGFRFNQDACEEGCQLRNVCPATSYDLMLSSYEAYYYYFYDLFSASKTTDYWYDYFSISEFDASATLVCHTVLVSFLAW
jgi:hypothetical protein